MRFFRASKKFFSAGALSVVLSVGSSPAAAQDWQTYFDLATAGAAASVILHHLCQGSEAGKMASEHAAKRLVNESAMVTAVNDATDYAREAYRLKLKAFEQTSSGESCASLTRLFDIAIATGFPVPRR